MVSQQRKNQLQQLLDKLSIELSTFDLLNTALTHPSFVFDKEGAEQLHNQRLEFLGDAVVDLIVGDYLFHEFPLKTEGELTKMRAALVCESTLANAAKRADLGEYLLIGKGERTCGGANRVSNLADAWEALIGALYLEKGIDAVRSMAIRFIEPEIEQVRKGYYGDYKTQLQEVVQKNPEDHVSYQILAEEGPDHDKRFEAGVYINKDLKAKGSGKTKKEAEQNAAFYALIKLGEIDG